MGRNVSNLLRNQVNVPEPPNNAALSRSHMAVHVALEEGVLRHYRNAPVLEVGCGNPYRGLYKILKGYGWTGAYVGIDNKMPAGLNYKNDIHVYYGKVLERLAQIPPIIRHWVKEYSTVFCVDSLKGVQNEFAEKVILEMRRIGYTVIVVNAPAELLHNMDFQVIDMGVVAGESLFYGLWFNEDAEKERSGMTLQPIAGKGWFSTESGVKDRRIFACRKCGELDYTGAMKFPCKFCKHENR